MKKETADLNSGKECMIAQTCIGNIEINALPNPEDIRHFFFDYSEDKWSVGGLSGAGFSIGGVEGTENEDPLEGQIHVYLSITDDPELGMYLCYRKTGPGYDGENYYALGDESRLTEFVESRVGDKLSKGLFVPPEIAWLAVKDFIEQGGARSDKVRWASENDLPEEAFPDPAEEAFPDIK
jgi:hypothetical protein